MTFEKNNTALIVALVFAIAIGVMGYYYVLGTDASIDWKVTTHAETNEFGAYEFQKGPFSFSIPGTYYTLTESFSAGPIERFFIRDGLLLGLCWLGLCIILATATLLSPIWFFGIAGLFLFMLIRLQMPTIGLFGFPLTSNWAHILLMVLFVAPAYTFHAFWKNTALWLRVLTLVGVSAVVVLFGGVELVGFQEQLNVGVYYSIIVVMLLFLLLIAEENVFGILYLVTKSKGGENNEKHFSIFSLVYLSFIGLVYCKKAGFIKMELPFFDPYVLLMISSVMLVWTLWHKRDLYESILTYPQALVLLSGVGLAVFGYLALAMSRGNDALYEGLHYFIIYAHLGFGVFFFLYVFVNFIDPLRSGLQVYKIAYKPRAFPYVSARIAGVVAVIAFFLLSDSEPFKLFKAGYFNYIGEQAELQNENALANQYYLEGSIYAHDNHFSNYKLAYAYLQNDKLAQANHKFGRATLRYPSPHSFVNESSTASMLGNVTPSLVALKSGLKRFPGEKPILNNLGLIYMDLGDFDEAAQYFAQAKEEDTWNSANTVNLWKLGRGVNVRDGFVKGNLAVKSNILASLLLRDEMVNLTFNDPDDNQSPWLHRQIYLINCTWYFGSGSTDSLLSKMTERPLDEGIYDVSFQALALSKYRQGDVNAAVRKLDQLYHLSSARDRAKYLNQIGLICLDQHALPLAHDFFDKALAEGYSEAKLNKGIAYLESGEFDLGLKWFQAMAVQDSAFIAVANDFEQILNGANPTDDQRLARMYYKYSEYSLPEIKVFVDGQDALYVQTLWDKISNEVLATKDFDLLEDYLSVLKPLLHAEGYADALAVVALRNNLTFSGEHPVAEALRNENERIRIAKLVEIASKNALNAPLVLAVTERSLKVDPSAAYDLLVEAIEINDQNVSLMQAYAMAALEIRLAEYALPVVEKLRNRMADKEYERFKIAFDQRRAELGDEGW